MRTERKEKPMKRSRAEKIYIILISLVIAAMAAVVIVWAVKRDAPAPESPAAAIELVQPTPQIIEREKIVEVEKEITSEIINDGLNEMGFLVTEEYYFTEVVSFTSVKKLFNLIELGITESAYLASYDGVVTAGINFENITVEKDDEILVVTVHLPEAELLNVDIDPESFILYSEKEGLGNPISVADFNNSLIELENSASEKAKSRGLLERAEENAEKVIRNFISGLVDTSVYTVKFTHS